MAIASPRVRAECIEANEFPELSQRYQVMAVPKVVINDRVGFEGALPERAFLGGRAREGGGLGRGRDHVGPGPGRSADRLVRPEPLGAAAPRHPDLSRPRRLL